MVEHTHAEQRLAELPVDGPSMAACALALEPFLLAELGIHPVQVLPSLEVGLAELRKDSAGPWHFGLV